MTTTNSRSERSVGAVYRSLVHSLFADTKVLFLGVIGTTGAVVLTAFATNSLVVYFLAALFALVGGLRCEINRLFHKALKQGDLTTWDYRKWEYQFTAGAVVYAALFGLWCFQTSVIGDPFAQLTSVAVTFATLIGVCGRTFPIGRVVDLQIAAVSVPIVAGLYVSGGYYIWLGLLIIPYLVSLKAIAGGLRETLLGNIFQRRKAEKLATQFDTALNNVPQGICMFDASGALEVSNRHIGRVIGRSQKSLLDVTATSLVKILVEDLGVAASDGEILKKSLESGSRSLVTHTFEYGLSDRRTIKFKAAPVRNGGTIATFEDITAEVKAATKIDHMTRFDRLTGLINRNQLPIVINEKLKSAVEDEHCAILLVNLDEFKVVNETLGHKIGDELICQFARRLTKIVGGVGICARFGGDEFAVILEEKDCLDIATNLADRIVDGISKEFKVGRRSVQIQCSIGIALNRNAKDDAESLLKNAELALMCVKNDGRGDWRVSNDDMSREIKQRRQLEADLKIAVENGQFTPHFQPIVSVGKGKVTVCEALIRWEHPKLGLVSPVKFIPLAEELGLIGDIGSWMIRESCRQCATWPNDTRVAVNLSPLQFKNGDVVETVKQALMASGLSPQQLELEITESLMLDDMGSTINKLLELKGLGVRISLDDFGTGYSSLSYMNSLPLDKVKIDRSFVRGLSTDEKALTLIQAISGLGKQLDLTVVVEGVEDDEELQILLENSQVDEIQGYYFSKPVASDEIAKLLDKRDLANQAMMSKLKQATRRAA